VIRSIVVITLLLIVLVAASQAVARTWSSADLLDCGDGRFGTTCQDFSDIQLSWAHPTQYEDGAPLQLSEISYYVIRVQRDSNDPVFIRVGKKTSHILKNRIPGSYQFAIATVAKGRGQGAFTDSLTLVVN
jgi:hypothetical protein